MCNRRETRRQGNKNDWQDARNSRTYCGAMRCDRSTTIGHHTRELKELARTYVTLVEDSTRVMARVKALYRARAIRTRGRAVYSPRQRATWLVQLPAGAVGFRAEALYAELEVLQALRRNAKAALLTAARRQPAWSVLRAIPVFGPVRVALLLAFLQTPWRFRTKRNLWAYAGLAVTTRTTAEYQLEGRTPVRRRRAPLTRGLNRNHHRLVKAIFKSAATTATTRPGRVARVLSRDSSPAGCARSWRA